MRKKRILSEGFRLYLREKMIEAAHNKDGAAFKRYSREYCASTTQYEITENEDPKP